MRRWTKACKQITRALAITDTVSEVHVSLYPSKRVTRTLVSYLISISDYCLQYNVIKQQYNLITFVWTNRLSQLCSLRLGEICGDNLYIWLAPRLTDLYTDVYHVRFKVHTYFEIKIYLFMNSFLYLFIHIFVSITCGYLFVFLHFSSLPAFFSRSITIL